MAPSDERSGSARLRAKAAAAAAYRAHVGEQRAKRWRIALIDEEWRVAVQHEPSGPWSEPVPPFPGVSDVGNCEERVRIVLDRDYDAARQGRVAYTVEITR